MKGSSTGGATLKSAKSVTKKQGSGVKTMTTKKITSAKKAIGGKTNSKSKTSKLTSAAAAYHKNRGR